MLLDSPLTITESVPDDLLNALVEKAGIKKIEMHADRVLGGPLALHTCTMVHFGKISDDIARFESNERSDVADRNVHAERALSSAIKKASEAPENPQPFLVVRVLSEISDNFFLPRGSEGDGFSFAINCYKPEMRNRTPISSLIFADSKVLKERGQLGILNLLPKPGATLPQMLKTILSTAKNEPPITIDDNLLYSDTTILAKGANAFTRKIAASLGQEAAFTSWVDGIRLNHGDYAMPGLMPRNTTSRDEDLEAKPDGRRTQV